MTVRYGVIWPDGAFTGGITEHYHHATHYAKTGNGRAYQVGGSDDPERTTTKCAEPQEEDFSDLC